MKFIYIFRHGETDWNVEKPFQGHTDIPLNPYGREQAKKLRSQIERLNLDVMLSSDLSRAFETAQIATTDMDLEIIRTRQLREAYLGDPEGKTKDEVISAYGQGAWDRWISIKESDLDFAFPNGEPKRQQLERCKSFLEAWMEENVNAKHIGVSTHGGVLRRLVSFAAGGENDFFPAHNCVLYKLSFDSQSKVWRFVEKLE